MEMPAGMSLYIPGDARIYAYFPATCIISILYDTESGKSSQIALTGNDGFVGVMIAMGTDSNTMQTAVQTPGYARSEEHTSELQSLMRISYAVFCLKNKKQPKTTYKKSIKT